MQNTSHKTIAVVGPTASGKSDIAVALAQAFGADFPGGAAVIGADSRQIYRHMNLGSGKEPGHLVTDAHAPTPLCTAYISSDVRHYMIDIVAPTTDYNGAKFVKKARRVMDALHQEQALPIVCGGTHFWVQSLLENTHFPTVAPDHALRTQLAHKTTAQLLTLLTKKDSRRAHNIITKNEQQNRHRLIRAIEIATALGAVPTSTPMPPDPKKTLILAVAPSMEQIKKNIVKRLPPRLRSGMLDEVYALHHTYRVPWIRLESFGLEYKWCTRFLRGHCSEQEMYEGIIRESRQFAKRQLTWLRRWEKNGAHIHWITTIKEASALTKAFISML